MKLIGRRKKQSVPGQALGYVALAPKALAAQRIARKAHTGYKWTRRLPFIVAGWAILAFIVRKVTQSRGGGTDAGFTPPPTTTTTPSPAPTTVPVSTPSTPTPTGSPTAVTPAPTAAADGAPGAEAAGDETPTGEDAESKS